MVDRKAPGENTKTANLRGESRGELAYQFLIDAISSGQLLPGTRIREVDIAKQTGLSRTPVREAINRLQIEGMVSNSATGGTIVTELDQIMISELYIMREVLEGTAAAQAARHASDVEISFLREINDRDETLKDVIDLVRNNRLFHVTLYRCSHNRYLLKMLNSLHESMMLLGASTLRREGRPSIARAEHAAIIDALENRDPEKASEAARHHIREAFKVRLETFFENLENPR